jgi:hypothetical protein
MISKATDHRATVLMNRRMNTERRVTTFGPVRSSVAGMGLCIISEERALRKGVAYSAGNNDVLRVVIWSPLVNPAMDCVRDERIIGESNRSSAHCHPKSVMGTVSDHLAGCAKCIAECNFHCRNVCLYRGRFGAWPDLH